MSALASPSPDELEVAVGEPEPDLKSVKDVKLRRKIARVMHGSALEAVFETVVKRTARRCILLRESLSLRSMKASCGRQRPRRSVCEAELELDEGHRRACSRPRQSYSAMSRSGLPTGARPTVDTTWRPAAPRTLRFRGTPRKSSFLKVPPAVEALAAMMQSATQQIFANRPVVLEGYASRRSPSVEDRLAATPDALWAFRPLLDTPASRDMDAHAHDLAQAVGELRDADVLLEDMSGQAAGVINGHAGLHHLEEALSAHRLQKRDAARAALQGKDWSALQLYLALLPRSLEEVKSLDRPVAKFASEALAASWKKVAKKGERIASLKGEDHHKMRKLLKKLRYIV